VGVVNVERQRDGVTPGSIRFGEPIRGEMPTNTRPPELVATCKVAIVGMCVFKDRLFIATSEGVFERLDDGCFHEVRLVKAGA
jgi:hypothetical protein